jgi:hypothetical protein
MSFLSDFQKTMQYLAKIYKPRAIACCVQKKPKIWQAIENQELLINKYWDKDIELFQSALGRLIALYKHLLKEVTPMLLDFSTDLMPEAGRVELELGFILEKQSKAGSPMLSAKFILEIDGDEGEVVDFEFWDNLVLKGKPKARSCHALKCLGAPVEEGSKTEFDIKTLEGNRIIADIDIELDNNNQPRVIIPWDGYISAAGDDASQVDAAEDDPVVTAADVAVDDAKKKAEEKLSKVVDKVTGPTPEELEAGKKKVAEIKSKPVSGKKTPLEAAVVDDEDEAPF